MKKVSVNDQMNIKGGISIGVTDYEQCPICGKWYSGWSLLGYIAKWVATGKANDCMYRD